VTQVLPPAVEVLLQKIGANGPQERVLVAIVAYSNRRYKDALRIATAVESRGPRLDGTATGYIPMRVLRWISVNQQTGCWESGTYAHKGYSRLYDEQSGRSGKLSYRYFYERMVRRLEPDEELDHLCRNRNCVWWELHLEPVTKAENNRRKRIAIELAQQSALFIDEPYLQKLVRLGLFPPRPAWRQPPPAVAPQPGVVDVHRNKYL
jgi:hypothetical protein